MSLLVLAGFAYAHWVRVPTKIEAIRAVGRKMPTRQLVTLERVQLLERWRSMLRLLMAVQTIVIVLLLRSLW